ncbi:MAG: LiaI-LiaF-like domain-containing protein [Anaerolineae bacterium]
MAYPNHHRRKPSLFWPLLLITVGGILLLSNLGILPPNAINMLWRFWPVGLILIGLDILLGRRSALGSILVARVALLLIGGALAFVFFARDIPDLARQIDLGELKHETISAPRQEIKTANLFIDWPGSPARLYALEDSNALIEGDINYYGTLYFETETRGSHADISLDSRIEQFFISTGGFDAANEGWEVGLHPGVTFNLSLDAGSGPGNYNLQDLSLKTLTIDAGSGPLTIALPASGQVKGVLDGGSGPIELTLPEGMEAKVVVDSGSGPFSAGRGFSKSQSNSDDVSVWLTEGFRGADNYIELESDQGSGPIRIK